MPPLLDGLERIRDFLDAGGYVLWAIFGVSLLLWTLIIERYYYLRRVHPRYLQWAQNAWQSRTDRTSWYAQKIRQAMVSEISLRLYRSLSLIRTLIAVCPLLGLLGTVTGMVHVFDVIAIVGSGHARALAAGVSMATIPTVAGMVVALSGLFFSTHLQQWAAMESQKATDLL
jgi:biopolymer transport protein ExbB